MIDRCSRCDRECPFTEACGMCAECCDREHGFIETDDDSDDLTDKEEPQWE